jgi:hypothetical protein
VSNGSGRSNRNNKRTVGAAISSSTGDLASPYYSKSYTLYLRKTERANRIRGMPTA